MSVFARSMIVSVLLAGLAVATGVFADAREDVRHKLGGATSRAVDGAKAFTFPAANLPANRAKRFRFGNRVFNLTWKPEGEGDPDFDGLGPTFNAPSCGGCHLSDGRGNTARGLDGAMISLLMRISVPGGDGAGPHPELGGQLQDRAVPGATPEGRVEITYEEIAGSYGDGTAFSLRKPRYRLRAPVGGPVLEGVQLSPRVAPQVIGLGLLEAIPEEALAAMADPDDKNGDGISGRINRVRDRESGNLRVGRFGWKANEPSLRQQNAHAFFEDMGLTSAVFPGEDGETPEVSEKILSRLTFYTQVLAVPERRDLDDPDARAGERIFIQIGCAACHVPRLQTGDHPNHVVANQTIRPFTDLLLHDMGEGLADGRSDGKATGREWRTPPLWGIGLIETVNGHTELLHDGRARNMAEAILWHVGEARRARERFRSLTRFERAALIKFLKSL